MPTKKPRVLVTLEPSRYAVLQDFALRRGIPVSRVIGALVEQVAGLLAWETSRHASGGPGSLPLDQVTDLLREVYPQKEDREALARVGDALDLLRASGVRVVSDHLAELAGGPGGGTGEHPAQPQPAARPAAPKGASGRPPSGKGRKGPPPYSNTGVTGTGFSHSGGHKARKRGG